MRGGSLQSQYPVSGTALPRRAGVGNRPGRDPEPPAGRLRGRSGDDGDGLGMMGTVRGRGRRPPLPAPPPQRPRPRAPSGSRREPQRSRPTVAPNGRLPATGAARRARAGRGHRLCLPRPLQHRQCRPISPAMASLPTMSHQQAPVQKVGGLQEPCEAAGGAPLVSSPSFKARFMCTGSAYSMWYLPGCSSCPRLLWRLCCCQPSFPELP